MKEKDIRKIVEEELTKIKTPPSATRDRYKEFEEVYSSLDDIERFLRYAQEDISMDNEYYNINTAYTKLAQALLNVQRYLNKFLQKNGVSK